MSKKKVVVGKAAKAEARGKVAKPRITKLGRLEAMLRKPEGATIAQLGKVLDWQAHSVRGAIAGALKRKGILVTNEQPENGSRIYRIA